MRIPRITIEFDRLICETEKAYQFTINGKNTWIPKALCSDLRINGKRLMNGQYGRGAVNIAPFKFEELTGFVPQSLDSLVLDDIQDAIAANELPDYDIIEPKGIYLKDIQAVKIAKIKRLKCFFVYGQMRTGKTVIATTIAESRMKSGMIDRIVVIAPLRTENVWRTHMASGFDFVANEHFSNIHTRKNIKLECDDRTMVILDESHQIKNQGVYRVARMINETSNAGHKCILTGTPIGKHAGDLYEQFYFLDPSILNYNSYSDFENAHLLYGGRDGKKVVAYTNIEEVAKRISPFTVTLSRSEMGIDREKQYELATYYPTNIADYEALRAKYEEMYEKGLGDSILGMMVKLQQCANGYIIDENDEKVGYADNGRVECLKKILEYNEGIPTVIYIKYNLDATDIEKMGIPILTGKTNRNKFQETIDQFNNGGIKVIAMQQQISIGFSLKAADLIVYYSRKFGSISSAQSEDRACESTDKPLRIIDIGAKDTIDEAIKSTINKQFDIINIFKTEIKNNNHESK